VHIYYGDEEIVGEHAHFDGQRTITITGHPFLINHERNSVLTGDVITFDHYDQTTTHRIVGVEGTANGTMFSTKGDANQVGDPEPLTFPGRVGLVKLAIPGLGYAVAWMQYIWRLGATIVAALIFFGCAAMVFLRKDKTAAPAPVTQKLPKRTIATITLAPVVVSASTLEAQRIWAEHERWLAQTARAAARAA